MSRRKSVSTTPFELAVDSLAHDGRGVGRYEDKVVFVDGALPGERVRAVRRKRKRAYDIARLEEVLEASPERVTPLCRHFEQCGGCRLQHLEVEAQLRVKQEALAENLKRIGGVAPAEWLEPLHAGAWGYRGKARLGVRYVRGKGRVLVGFREKGSSLITDTERCEVLVPSVGEKIQALCRLIDGLSIREQVPQIEVAAGDRQTCLVFRTLTPPEAADRERLCDFGTEHGFSIYIQPGGPETVQPLAADSEPLFYDLPQWRLRLYFQPQDFTQVNMAVNRRMLDRALELLDVRDGDRVLDLFCGLGNFSLPLARAGARVTGVEGDAAMVERARRNAELNGIESTAFHTADLFESPSEAAWWPPAADKVVLDPPRSGAEAAVERLPRLGAEKILYVSCNPATLARDAAVLVHQGGYRLAKAGVVDMFPHTAHSEAMALFTGPGK